MQTLQEEISRLKKEYRLLEISLMNQKEQQLAYFYDNVKLLKKQYGSCAHLAIFGDYHNPRVVVEDEVDKGETEPYTLVTTYCHRI